MKEPLVRIVKRDMSPISHKIFVRAAAIILALVVDALFIYFVTGLNPINVYVVMFKGSFGNQMRFLWALRDMVTLLGIGIALAPAFKMKFWNIGAEGQVLIGGLATALVMVYCGNTFPAPVLFILMVASAIIAGGVWGLIPAVFKSRWGTNETLFTLMMNYIAISFTSAATNYMRGQASSLGKLNMGTKAGWMPKVFGQSFNVNIIVILVLMVVMFIYLTYSKHGYEITVVGESENTALYAGINVTKVRIRTMIISGAICGLVGFLLVSGRDQTISTNTAGGNGFTAIIVAWLAKFNPFYMALIAILLTFLSKGAAEIASTYALNDFAADILTGIILFFILGSEFFINYKLIFRHKEVKG